MLKHLFGRFHNSESERGLGTVFQLQKTKNCVESKFFDTKLFRKTNKNCFCENKPSETTYFIEV